MGVETLVRMANQIADNNRYLSADEAAAAVAAHLRSFWAPEMRADLIAYVDSGGDGVEQVVREALDRLRQS
jgi:formate dehydrogenase subunit delta